jgi:hypothetical protein
MNVTAIKILTHQRSRTLTNGERYILKSFILMYRTEDTVWHEYPGAFSDREQAVRLGREMKKTGI